MEVLAKFRPWTFGGKIPLNKNVSINDRWLLVIGDDRMLEYVMEMGEREEWME